MASPSRPHPQNGSGELGREERGAPPPTPGTGTGSATPGGGTRSKRRRLPRCNATPTGYTTIPSTDLNSSGSCGEGVSWLIQQKSRFTNMVDFSLAVSSSPVHHLATRLELHKAYNTHHARTHAFQRQIQLTIGASKLSGIAQCTSELLENTLSAL